MSHTGARASAGHEIQACLCGLLSLRALQLKGQWGIAPPQKFYQDTNTTGPSAVGAEPAWMDQLLDKLEQSK